jgi:hypothetical protein
VRITSLANKLARMFQNKNWQEFEKRKQSMFRQLGKMVRSGTPRRNCYLTLTKSATIKSAMQFYKLAKGAQQGNRTILRPIILEKVLRTALVLLDRS